MTRFVMTSEMNHRVQSPPPCTSRRGCESLPSVFQVLRGSFLKNAQTAIQAGKPAKATMTQNPLSFLPEIQGNSEERETWLCLPSGTHLQQMTVLFTETQQSRSQQ